MRNRCGETPCCKRLAAQTRSADLGPVPAALVSRNFVAGRFEALEPKKLQEDFGNV